MEASNLFILPNEIWIKIFSYVHVRYQRNVRLVSQQWKELMDLEFKKKFVIRITKKNLKEVKKCVDEKNLNFWNLEFVELNIESEEQHIIQGMGDRLEHLAISYAEISGNLTENLKNLKSLQLHHFDYNSEFKLAELPFLEHLDLEGCHLIITNDLLSQLAKNPTKSLKTLKVDADYDENFLIDVLKTHTTIEDLGISKPKEYKIHENMWQQVFANLKNIRKLDIHFKGERLKLVFETLPQESPLQHVDFDNSQSEYGILEIIRSKWKNSLESIAFKYCSSLSGVEQFTNLRVLDIRGCNGITSKAIFNAIAKIPNLILEEFKIQIFYKLDESYLFSTFENLPNLRFLSLIGVGNDQQNNIMRCINQFLTHLRILHIFALYITDEGILGFGENPYCINRLQELEELVMDYGDKLTDRCLSAFQFPQLRLLELNLSHKITIKGLELLAKNCPSLETLGISADSLLDPNSVQIIGSGFKMLRSLCVFWNYRNIDRKKSIDNLKNLRKGISYHLSFKA